MDKVSFASKSIFYTVPPVDLWEAYVLVLENWDWDWARARN